MNAKTTEAKKTTFYATRFFKDAGTERTFEFGAELTDLDEGTLRNYAAAGVASTEKPKAEEATSDATATKPSDNKPTA